MQFKNNGILKNKDCEFKIYNVECIINIYEKLKKGSFITDKKLNVNDKFDKIDFKFYEKDICIEFGDILNILVNKIEYLGNEKYKVYYIWNGFILK